MNTGDLIEICIAIVGQAVRGYLEWRRYSKSPQKKNSSKKKSS